MKLTKLKCPNCGGKLRIEDDKESAVCIHCDYEFLIDDEQPVINHNYYYNNTTKPAYTPNKATKPAPSPRPLSIFSAIVAVLVFIAFVSRLNNSKPSPSSGFQEVFQTLTAKTAPESLPMKLFVEYVFSKPTAQITPADYSTIKYLEVYRDDEIGSEDWVFNYSFEDYASTKDFDSTIHGVYFESKETIEVSDFQIFSELTALVVPEYDDFTNEDDLPPLVRSKTLTKFNAEFSNSYDHLLESLESPEQLKHISVQLYSDPDFDNLLLHTNLESIHIRGISETYFDQSRLVELNNLKKLTELRIDSAKDISWLSSISNLQSLTLDAYSVESFEVLYALPNLVKLDLNFVDNIKSLDFVKNMPKLKELRVTRSSILNLEPLRDSKALLTLELEDNSSLSDASAIVTLTSLKKLYLKSNGLTSIDDLSSLVHLESLSLSSSLLEKVAPSNSVKSLLVFLRADMDVAIIPNTFPNLTDLEFSTSTWEYVENLPSLSRLALLKNLRLHGVYTKSSTDYAHLFSTTTAESIYLQDIQLRISSHLLSPNPNLKALDIGKKNSIYLYDQNHNSIEGSLLDIPDFFINFPNLESLIIQDRKISSLDFVEQLPNLKYLDLRDNYISDVSPLTKLKKLEAVVLENNPVSNSELLSKNIHLLTGKLK